MPRSSSSSSSAKAAPKRQAASRRRAPSGRRVRRDPGTGPRRKKRSILWRTRNVFLVLLLVFVAGVSGAVWVVWDAVDLPTLDETLAETTYICSADVPEDCTADNSIAQLSGGEDREIVAYEEIPQVLIDAVIATEDKDFFEHKGVDPVGVARAFWSNVTEEDSEATQGGSTITQQYVKNVYLTPERTYERKINEAIMALKLERELPKKEILERYLNTIYFGRGAYGVAAAARDYFGKDLDQIGLPEASYLAGIIRAPEAADANRPATDPTAAAQREAATERRSQVLGQMLGEGFITAEEHDAVDAMGWEYVVERSTNKNFGNVAHAELGSEYFIEYVRQWLLRQDVFPLTDAEIYGGGLRVYTTIDWNAQAKAYEAILAELNRPDDPVASLVAVDHEGNVRAMIGGYDWNASQVNLAAGIEGGGSGRQPGSSFKTFGLVAALEQGMSLGQYYNAPGRMQLSLPGGEIWDVGNYGDAGLGTLDLVGATVNSSNTAYAQLALDVGSSSIVETAHRMGVRSELPEFPAVVLGTGSVSVLDMTAGYATLASEGMKVGAHVVTRVTDAEGTVLYDKDRDAPATQVVDPQVARNVNWVLNQVVQRGTGTKAQFAQPAAGKTGTTEDYRDAWFAGFTCHYTAAVWVGYPGPETRYMKGVHGINVAGGTFPTQIWQRFMSSMDDGSDECPAFPRPSYAPVAPEGTYVDTTTGTVDPSAAVTTEPDSSSTSSSSSSSTSSSTTSSTVPSSSTTAPSSTVPSSTVTTAPGGGAGAGGDP